MKLSMLTVNIGAAARERAGAILGWLRERSESVFVLTETSSGAGTAYMLDRFRAAGFSVVHTPDKNGDRGAAIVSRVRLREDLTPHFSRVSIPGRVVAARLSTKPEICVLGTYVPSRDRTPEKIKKKEMFVGSLLSALGGLPEDVRRSLVIGGDYNVIARSHRPPRPGFLPFELGLLEALDELGLTDAYERCSPGEQAYSWIGRTGEGYRYDYFHVGRAVAEKIRGCSYLHETREKRLSDHAAMTLGLRVDVVEELKTRDPREPETMTLF